MDTYLVQAETDEDFSYIQNILGPVVSLFQLEYSSTAVTSAVFRTLLLLTGFDHTAVACHWQPLPVYTQGKTPC